MADVRAVLQRCDPALLDECDDPDQLDCVEAARMDLYLTESRRVQKVVWRQLFVLDSMVALLEGQESAQQLMTLPCPPPPDGSARARWKALKAESRAGVEETEGLFKSLERIEQIHERRQTLTQLVQRLHNKKQQTKQLVEALKKAKNALQSCEHQLIQLMAEAEAGLGRLIDWQQLRDELQAYMSAVQDVMQINLLSFNQSELCVELRPRPTSRMSSNELEPLRLSITWSHDDRFRLQVNEGTAGLEEDSIVGRRSELSAALLEVMQCYEGQFELLSEIQGLRSSFAIDWRPTQRLLIYLKSALLVCHLEVEEGYPSSGRARLLSVRRDGQPVDTSELKPYKSDLSLTDWLVFLCSSPLI
ncbi:uncharacterized protein si:dkey-225f5.4 isoform X2 [Cheilinus undulatus]|uniref:uncharacterized protein si:dkey-225f5.4 isoform X2 n=1 Tax=Cheilinus undulatus TaxID=241271 RepID=UPI001BD642B0|nr:uncharacterized protein si:dkey-225f5.4 isoform X2 [Cheilinus undulatus]